MFLEMFINGNGNFVDENEVLQIDCPLPVFIIFDSRFPPPSSLKGTFLCHLGLTMEVEFRTSWRNPNSCTDC